MNVCVSRVEISGKNIYSAFVEQRKNLLVKPCWEVHTCIYSVQIIQSMNIKAKNDCLPSLQ